MKEINNFINETKFLEIQNLLKKREELTEIECYKISLALLEMYSQYKMQNYPNLLKSSNGVAMFGLGFCYIMGYIIGENSAYSWYNSKTVVKFIKVYGKFSTKMYDCDGAISRYENSFIYPIGDIDSRLDLITTAIKNFKDDFKLTIEDQIEVLKSLKSIFNNPNKSEKGLCKMITNTISEKYGYSNIYMGDIIKLIPLFTSNNAIIACREKHVVLPNINNMWWWDWDNHKSRIAFVNWMIQKLKENG